MPASDLAAGPSPASPIRVLSAVHTGITVRSLERSSFIFRDLLGLKFLRPMRLEPPLSAVVGHAEADIAAAHLELPGGHQIEILQYNSPASSAEYRPRPWQLGSFHLCLVVEDMDRTVRTLTQARWQGRSLGWALLADAQTLTAGPNAGSRVCYMQDDDGLTLEFFQRPRAA